MSYRHWIGTLAGTWIVPTELPEGCVYIKGQKEKGEGGFEHYQIIAYFKKTQRLSAVKTKLGDPSGHWEPTRSRAAEDYVWKESTRIPDTQFELGTKPMRRAEEKDWALVLENAKAGKLNDIPADIFIRCYTQLTRISKDYMAPVGIVKQIHVFWGGTGTGKSRTAWEGILQLIFSCLYGCLS